MANENTGNETLSLFSPEVQCSDNILACFATNHPRRRTMAS